jgi:hypothetical protein
MPSGTTATKEVKEFAAPANTSAGVLEEEVIKVSHGQLTSVGAAGGAP